MRSVAAPAVPFVERQVVVTSHSGDLLDTYDLAPEALIAVIMEGGKTRMGPVEAVGRSAMRDLLFTAGELLRQDQLQPTAGDEAEGF